MLPTTILYALLTAITISAVPLNINLGAYSPALVVGDGEISFDSSAKASELMETLATGAVTAGQQAENPAPQGNETPAPPEEPAQKARAIPANGAAGPHPNVRSPTPAPAPAPEPAVARRAVDTLDDMDLVAEATQWIKRDIAGFREALNFAREAMKNTPKIELGTENAGVGIIQNGGLNVAADSAANGAPPPGGVAEKKRSVNVRRGLEAERSVEEEKESPKMTLVAITEV